MDLSSQSNEVKAYIAGIIDGEGCVTVNKRKHKSGSKGFVPTVSIGMTYQALIVWLAHITNRKWKAELKRKLPHHKPMYRVDWRNQRAKEFLLEILPYLKVKKEQAELLILLCDMRLMNRQAGALKTTNMPDQARIVERLTLLKRTDSPPPFVRPKITLLEHPVRHGTRFGYKSGCRCNECRAANATHSRTMRARQKAA